VTYEDTGETLKDEPPRVRKLAHDRFARGAYCCRRVRGRHHRRRYPRGRGRFRQQLNPLLETVTYIESNPVETSFTFDRLKSRSVAGVPQDVRPNEIPSAVGIPLRFDIIWPDGHR